MKVTNIKYIKTIKPNSCSGTGYSEPDIFEFELDNKVNIKISIDIWYLTEDSIRNRFNEEVKYRIHDEIENLDEAYEMYLNVHPYLKNT